MLDALRCMFRQQCLDALVHLIRKCPKCTMMRLGLGQMISDSRSHRTNSATWVQSAPRCGKSMESDRYGSSIPTDTTMQILGSLGTLLWRLDFWSCSILCWWNSKRWTAPASVVGDMVAFITDTDLYITDLCVQIAVQVLVPSFAAL